MGFNVEKVVYKNLNLTVWDVGGQNRIRALWKHYYRNSNGVIYVIDSNDRERIDEAAEELTAALMDPDLGSVPILVYSNKIDLPKSMPLEEVRAKLNLEHFKNHPSFLQASSIVNGTGIFEGLDWLAAQLLAQR
eukprot:TRINITY_DN1419_c1_g1_i5.p1 TRINITY_DN1419_c1_g1~~TRINITY_DN1419_c1_g1_i5.p1  ORF type:complete len:134 (-),score=34.80 TRINITY_DN1419_c1_g1_i5:314-715(-)